MTARKITLQIALPKTPADAALILLEQMRDAIVNGEVKTTEPKFDRAMGAWLASADRVLSAAVDGRVKPGHDGESE